MTERDVSLDVMRGLAIVSMVEIHFLLHFRPDGASAYQIMRSLGALAAPFFLICAGGGVGYLLSRKKDDLANMRVTLQRRGLFLMVFASLLGTVHLDWTQILDWDIFTLIGAMYILISFLAATVWFGPAGVLVVVLLLDTLLPQSTPAVLRRGSFPIIPLAAYFLVGMLLVQLRHFLQQKWARAGAMLSALALIISIQLWTSHHVNSLTSQDVRATVGVVLISSLFLLLWLGIGWLTERHTSSLLLFRPFQRLGKLSFSIYYVQYLFLLIIPLGLEFILQSRILVMMPVSIWLVSLMMFCGWLYLIVNVWERFDYRFSLEWIIHHYISPRSMWKS